MKKIVMMSLLALGMQSCIYVKTDGNGIGFNQSVEASGPMVEKEYSLNFKGIQVKSGIKAEVFKSNENKVVVSIPENIQDKILVEVSGGVLQVGFKPNSRINFRGNNSVRVKIYTQNLESIKASSSADIELRDKFTQEKIQIAASSSGSVKGEVEANDLSIQVSSSGSYYGSIWAINGNLDVSSSGDIVVSGSSKNLEANASSSGDIKAKDLKVEIAKVKASSSADIALTVSKNAEAAASSSADVVIYRLGNPNIQKSESSSGSVEVKN
ncbi:head GIN domain-containing protein [Elizabethkingia sp. JS20170427COW]|uniref:head GIN domain-containing protein n=1 Tax=Elizabethkingia sp. JS20170427COW TaxID=2583851 RepID=UPI001110331E|nr:head GIN domain-containing protein [Elizabethkingia sp. JS20170427COW]QCX53476.1 DUF2807 domain-containing protein [Elizabethkingia sp. JS20170427COW]